MIKKHCTFTWAQNTFLKTTPLQNVFDPKNTALKSLAEMFFFLLLIITQTHCKHFKTI